AKDQQLYHHDDRGEFKHSCCVVTLVITFLIFFFFFFPLPSTLSLNGLLVQDKNKIGVIGSYQKLKKRESKL
ncbi:hypothetical protein PP707_07985, partial [Acetobacter pasteurianus]|nr:hypothetical protein [Acetobacter pasteurianus]